MRVRCAILLLILMGSSGCRRSHPGRVEVTGEVKLQGQLVADGQIRFIPQKGTAGPITIEPIKGGKYACKYGGGVPIGEHRVEIRAWDPKVPEPVGPGALPRPQLAPEKYNTKSELTLTLNGSSGAITKDFEL